MNKYHYRLIAVVICFCFLFMLPVNVCAVSNAYDKRIVAEMEAAIYTGADKEEIQEKLDAAHVDISVNEVQLDSVAFIQEHQEIITPEKRRTNASLPSQVDHSSQFPSPSQTGQGNQGSCTAWASAYFLKSGIEKINKGWARDTENHLFSPAYIFNPLTDNGSGISLGAAMLRMFTKGVCPYSYMPYHDDDYTTQPNAIQDAAAKLYIIEDFYTTNSIESIKRNIYENGGVCISVLTYPDFVNLNSTNSIYDTIDATTDPGYHSICLIGYDDSLQAFKFINSWNRTYGLNGYGWISYDLVNNPNVNLPGAGVSFVMTYQNNNVIMGDVNGDGSVTNTDATMVLQHSASLTTLTAEQFVLADVDGDGDVDTTDAQNILKYASNTISKFPIYN